MKRTLIILLFLFGTTLQAKTTISGKVQQQDPNLQLKVNVPFDCWYYKELDREIKINSNGSFSIDIELNEPKSIFFQVNDQRLLLYAEPGKDIRLDFSPDNLYKSLVFSGDLAAENRFRKDSGLLIFALDDVSFDFQSAELKDVVAEMQKAQQKQLRILEKKKRSFTPKFSKMTKNDLLYFPIYKLLSTIISDSILYRNNKAEWVEVLIHVNNANPVSNSNAVNSYYYQHLITYYSRFINLSSANKEILAEKVEDIMEKPFEEALKEIKANGERFWEYRVVTSVFRGEVLEMALASMLENAIRLGELDYLPETYQGFKERFPQSRYANKIELLIKPVLERESGKKISFETENNSNDSLSKILKTHEGRVVLIDLWGTWCPSCRKNFAHIPKLKSELFEMPVDFVYIAFEYKGENPERLWKRTVNFYNLEGRHILAGNELKSKVPELYGKTGRFSLPRYLLADKTGKLKEINAPSPAESGKLIAEIKKLL